MEGRSVLSVTLVYIIILDCSRQPAVLSVTLVYIIILDCSRQPASGSQPASRTEATAATGAIFSLSEKKELGKGGGGVESSGDQGFF